MKNSYLFGGFALSLLFSIFGLLIGVCSENGWPSLGHIHFAMLVLTLPMIVIAAIQTLVVRFVREDFWIVAIFFASFSFSWVYGQHFKQIFERESPY